MNDIVFLDEQIAGVGAGVAAIILGLREAKIVDLRKLEDRLRRAQKTASIQDDSDGVWRMTQHFLSLLQDDNPPAPGKPPSLRVIEGGQS